MTCTKHAWRREPAPHRLGEQWRCRDCDTVADILTVDEINAQAVAFTHPATDKVKVICPPCGLRTVIPAADYEQFTAAHQH